MQRVHSCGWPNGYPILMLSAVSTPPNSLGLVQPFQEKYTHDQSCFQSLKHLTSNIPWHTSLLITGVYFLLGGVKSTQLSLWVFTNIEILEFQMRYTFQNFFRTGQPQYPPCPVIEWERQFYPILIRQTHFEFLVQFQSQAAQNIRPIRILCLTLPKCFFLCHTCPLN